MKRSIEVVKVEGDFSRLKPIDNSEFILRLLTRPEFKGAKGDRGAAGKDGESIVGPQGIQGIAGPPGLNGKDGVSITGPRGERGLTGSQGQPGIAGRDGRAGSTGAMGPRGPKGDRGDIGPRGPKGDPGIQGIQGVAGPMPKHEWDKTKLRFEMPNKTWGPWVDLKGNSVVYSMASTGPSQSSDSLWEKVTINLPASSSQVVTSVPMASLRHGEFIINLRSSVSSKEKSLKIAVVNDESTLKDQVYSRSGAAMNVDFVSAVNGSNFELVADNYEDFDVSLVMVKLIL